MPNRHILPIVGAHFRPPAKALLSVLAQGTELTLVPEPENPYDQFAVKVVVSGTDAAAGADSDDLNAALIGTGWDADSIAEQEEFHLGYIPKTEASWAQGLIQAEHGANGAPGVLAFTVEGKPAVAFLTEGSRGDD